ncbi:MAG: gamma-glutamyl-gamma-aminobutyrate hydrolase family protein [Acidaminococcus sp.]|jgi:putative glutamine amidotransferase|nr:gamma-glutamyl-gamma-aminobutyrate hydrolase family protein [Acidaminococcus sp.]MCI2115361.1 gamma-glutamyl-gamma-aminobutyrate hydrolase family protein [Acidaminococcus sp.]MCI2117413.1 gamma-glutamyl-gamma-aminobutyrate hydrolase family protein [Acidaminococcus sp.]
MKPIIGITVNYDPRDTVIGVPGLGLPGQDWEFLACDYIYAVEKAGGIPFLIPYCRDKENLTAILEKVDGILISGGHDIDPNRFGARPMPYCGRVVPERDDYDLTIFHYGYEHKLPMLGICRGIQVMNVAMGGTVYQDLGKEAHLIHCYMGDVASKNYRAHETRFAEGSLLHKIFGDAVRTNSFHHQGIHEPGKNVTITAQAEDGAVEGIEIKGGAPFIVGVQWHPEMMFDAPEQPKLFETFVKACKKG